MVIKIVYNSEVHNIKDIIDELNTRHQEEIKERDKVIKDLKETEEINEM